MKNYTVSLQSQGGVVLVVALVMLLIMTMVGVKTISDSTTQERMASNSQQLSLARVNAFSALITAEQFIEGLDLQNEDDMKTAFKAADDSLYISLFRASEKKDEPALDMTKPGNWSSANSIAVTSTTVGFTDSRFFVEYIGKLVNNRNPSNPSLDAEDKGKTFSLPLLFRITALGYGANEKNTSILQSIYSTEQGFL